MNCMCKTKRSFKEIHTTITSFKYLISRVGLTINPSSELNRICENALALEEIFQGRLVGEFEDKLPEFMSEAMGIYDFAKKLLAIEGHENFSELTPHFHLLNQGSVAQNIKSRVTDQASNKLFELYLVAVTMPKGRNLKLDDPNSAKGDNPDILIDLRGRRWGFACKVVHSANEKTIFQNIAKAMSQIDNSDCEIGIPVINMKNIVDHAALWPLLNQEEVNSGKEPIWGAFIDIDHPKNMINSIVQDLFNKYQSDEWRTEFTELFKNTVKPPPAIMYILQGGSSVVKNKMPIPTRLNVTAVMPFRKFQKDEQKILRSINRTIQCV